MEIGAQKSPLICSTSSGLEATSDHTQLFPLEEEEQQLDNGGVSASSAEIPTDDSVEPAACKARVAKRVFYLDLLGFDTNFYRLRNVPYNDGIPHFLNLLTYKLRLKNARQIALLVRLII